MKNYWLPREQRGTRPLEYTSRLLQEELEAAEEEDTER